MFILYYVMYGIHRQRSIQDTPNVGDYCKVDIRGEGGRCFCLLLGVHGDSMILQIVPNLFYYVLLAGQL